MTRPCETILLSVLVIGCSRDPLQPRPDDSAAAPFPQATASASSASPASSTLSDSAPQRAPEPATTAPRSVLHFGDSMVPLVGNYLRPAFEAKGARYEMLSTHSSGVASWAADARLETALAATKADLVLISLGTNDLFTRELEVANAAIRAIVQKVAPRRCLWIAPPAWTRDFGFGRTLREAATPCGFFDSTTVKFTRQTDGKHPDWSSSYRWASAVWQALGETTSIPLR
jgi:hypothetical protein